MRIEMSGRSFGVTIMKSNVHLVNHLKPWGCWIWDAYRFLYFVQYDGISMSKTAKSLGPAKNGRPFCRCHFQMRSVEKLYLCFETSFREVFPKVQLTTSQYWLRKCPDLEQAQSHCRNQNNVDPIHWRKYASPCVNDKCWNISRNKSKVAPI